MSLLEVCIPSSTSSRISLSEPFSCYESPLHSQVDASALRLSRDIMARTPASSWPQYDSAALLDGVQSLQRVPLMPLPPLPPIQTDAPRISAVEPTSLLTVSPKHNTGTAPVATSSATPSPLLSGAPLVANASTAPTAVLQATQLRSQPSVQSSSPASSSRPSDALPAHPTVAQAAASANPRTLSRRRQQLVVDNDDEVESILHPTPPSASVGSERQARGRDTAESSPSEAAAAADVLSPVQRSIP